MFSSWTTWWSSLLWPEDTSTAAAAATVTAAAAAATANDVTVSSISSISSSSSTSNQPLPSSTASTLSIALVNALTTTTTTSTPTPASTTAATLRAAAAVAWNRTAPPLQQLRLFGDVVADNATDMITSTKTTTTTYAHSNLMSPAVQLTTDGVALLLDNYTGWLSADGRSIVVDDDGVTASMGSSNFSVVAAANNTEAASFGLLGAAAVFLDSADFSEDELLMRSLWDNGSDVEVAGQPVSPFATLVMFALANGTRNETMEPATWLDWMTTPDALQLLVSVVTATVLGFIILATVIGNVFVIAAILLERNLQSVANYLILSLAVADLLVAGLVMPLSAVYLVSDEWSMGPELCDMWTSSDVLCCTASILHLVAIALDRYWAVTNIDYIHQRTARRIGVMIAVVWTLSMLVSVAPLFGWKDPKWYERVVHGKDCMVSQDIGYQIFATASSFYVPLLVILVLYWRIFQTARKRIRRRQQISLLTAAQVGGAISATSGGLIASAAGGSGGIAAAVITIIGRPLPTISETTTAFTNVSSANTSPEKCSQAAHHPSHQHADRSTTVMDDPPTADYMSTGYQTTPTVPKTPAARKKAHSASADSKRERKAAKTLAIITGAFVCCWLPFFLMAIVLPACGDQCAMPEALQNFLLWLGYFNSTLNPIIYTVFSPEFRNAFKRLLCGRKGHIRRRTGVMRR